MSPRGKARSALDVLAEPNMQTVYPTLRITDEEKARDFYVRRLGFGIDWEWRHEPGFPVFMQVSRDGLAFYLSEHSGDCEPGGLVYLYVPDVDRWHAELVRAEVPIESPPANHPWGLRSMTVRDPDGNQLCIATRLDSGSGGT